MGESTGVVPQGRFPEGTYREAALFRVALRAFFRAAEDNARAEGLTPQQWMLLLALRGHPSYPVVSLAEITESLQIREPSASLLVDRTVKKGHVLRVKNVEDRRKVRLCLTAEGQKLLDHVMGANRQELRQLDWGRVAQSMREALDAPVL